MVNSPLRKLPPELRNYDYELVLYNDGYDHYVSSSRNRTAYLDFDEENKQPLALTQTCRVIRKETLGTFFAINRFAFYVHPGEATLDVWQLRAAIRTVNDQALRHIKISIDVQDCQYDLRKAIVCSTCFYFLKDLKKLYEWSSKHDVVVDLELRGCYIAKHVPVDFKHLCTSGKAEAPRYVARYEKAWLHGWGLRR